MANDKDRAEVDLVADIHFEQDIAAFDQNISLNEELYKELHDVFKRTTGGTMAFGATRDIAELGRTLSSVRSTGIEAVNKRFAAKKSIVELKQKVILAKKEETGAGAAEMLVKAVLGQLHGQSPSDQPEKNPGVNASPTGKANQTFGSGSTQLENRRVSAADREKLNQRVKNEIASGGITLTKNDLAMKHDFKGVEYVYDEAKTTLCAMSKETGKIISDYPNERLPRAKIVKIIDGKAMSDNGASFKVYKENNT